MNDASATPGSVAADDSRYLREARWVLSSCGRGAENHFSGFCLFFSSLPGSVRVEENIDLDAYNILTVTLIRVKTAQQCFGSGRRQRGTLENFLDANFVRDGSAPIGCSRRFPIMEMSRSRRHFTIFCSSSLQTTLTNLTDVLAIRMSVSPAVSRDLSFSVCAKGVFCLRARKRRKSLHFLTHKTPKQGIRSLCEPRLI